MTEEEKTLLFNVLGIIIVFVILGYFALWMARKSWDIYESLDKIEKRVSVAKSIIELEECISDIEKLNLFHPSHNQEVQKIMDMIKVKMQYLS